MYNKWKKGMDSNAAVAPDVNKSHPPNLKYAVFVAMDNKQCEAINMVYFASNTK